MTNNTNQPTIFVLYGATGDLARRMVLPAFYGLSSKGLMPDDWYLVGNGRGHRSADDFRKEIRTALDDSKVEVDDTAWSKFSDRLYFAGGGFSEDDPGEMLDTLKDLQTDDTALVHYMAVPPESFRGFTAAIKKHGLDTNAKAIFEKPFGTSPSDFEDLDKFVHTVFDEADVFRIDHFLGKEGTQDIHVARFANRLLENVWNKDNVAAVQIDIPEVLDIDDRAKFYDATGALLDMIVTHLFQLAAEVAMETPISLHPDDLIEARESVISAFRPLSKDEVVLGQYEGYLDVEDVKPDSETDTYVAARLWVDTERWSGVPFLLRTGKMLAVKAERVTLILRRTEESTHHQPETPPSITFELSGTGALEITTTVKTPGPDNDFSSATMRVELNKIGPGLQPYERLIHDAILGDKGRFTRPDGLGYAWKAITPLLEDKPELQKYEPKSWGPDAAKELAAPYGWLVGE